MANKRNHVTIRAKKVKSGYSLFLDYNRTETVIENGAAKTRRKFLFLGKVVKHNYTKEKSKRLDPEDKDNWHYAKMMQKQEQESEDFRRFPEMGAQINTHLPNASFIEFCKKSVDKKSNPSTYKAALNHFTHFIKKTRLKEDISFGEVNPNLIINFKEYLANSVLAFTGNKPLSIRSQYHYLKRIMIMWHEAMKREIITHDPFKNISFPKIQKVHKDYLTVKEIKKLRDTTLDIESDLVKMFKQAFLFSCAAGLRFGEYRDLRWDNIKEWRGIEGAAIDYHEEKNKKRHFKPLTQQAIQIIQRMPQDTELVFKGLPKGVSYINKVLKKWVSKAGISKKITTHTGRTTYINLLHDNGVDGTTISKLVGHSNLATTMNHYFEYDEVMSQASDSFPEW